MGDYYQTAADLDADVQTAEATAARLRDWMVSQQIIVADQSGCVLGNHLGHAPAKNYTIAAKEPYPFLFELRTNGVAFIAKHTVFYSAGIGETTLVCSACGRKFGSNEAWSTALDEWFKGNGQGVLPCEHCGAEAPITEWRHDPPWAFGNVGVEFWNWPSLREDFLKALGEVVGHRFRLVYGKF
jgi:hypothetical protein